MGLVTMVTSVTTGNNLFLLVPTSYTSRPACRMKSMSGNTPLGVSPPACRNRRIRAIRSTKQEAPLKKMLPSRTSSKMKQKTSKRYPRLQAGAVCAQFKRCGKDNCRCARGALHGPYFYEFWRENGRQRKAYVKREDVAARRAKCAERRRMHASLRAQLAAGRKQWRVLMAQFRSFIP